MVWFRVDDDFYDHTKVTAIPSRQRNAAAGLWVRAGSWSSRHLSDGRIPGHIVETLNGTEPVLEQLIKAGLWMRLDDGDYLFRQWADRNPTRQEVLEQREIAAQRQRDHRAKQKRGRGR